MRLIDADTLNARLSRNCTPYFTVSDIDNAPTVDADLVVEAEWVPGDKMPNYPRIPYISGKHYCSHCEMPAITHDSLGVYYGKVVFQEYLTPRCPYCGAKMKDEG